jgi:hypothetical protein
MSVNALEPLRWSRRRWITTTLVVLFGQIALILYLGESPHQLARAIRSKTSIHLAVDDWSAKQITELATLDDPTLLALPSIHGFSGKAWLSFPALKFQASEWKDAPSYLALETEQLGKTFKRFTATNEPTPVQLVGKPVADLLTLQLTIPPINLRTASAVRVEGSLQKRRLLEPLGLCSWPHEDLLTNSIVQLLVNELGDTVSTTLLTSSTLKDADEFALKAARGARFEPLRLKAGASPYSSGRLVFQWHTTPPLETNTASVQP